MPKLPALLPEKKQKSSPDYPLLVRKLFEASGDNAISKLPAALYLVATPIGNLGDISLRALTILLNADLIACEDTRNSGLLLAKFGIKRPLISYHDHNESTRQSEILKHIKTGQAVALISDAGMPLIADPGYRLVCACRNAGYDVTVIPGANAALAALTGSGLPTAHFHFAGFLPPKATARQKSIAALKNISVSLIFYETPPRLAATLQDLAEILGATRPAAVARELTKLYEETRGGTLTELANFYADHNVKGEIVIVLGPPVGNAEIVHDIDELLKTRLKVLSTRDAVDEISAMTGVKKSDVYARALALDKK